MTYSLDSSLTAAHADVKAEIARTDTKASLLFAFTGAVLAGLGTVAASVRVPLAAMVPGVAGLTVLVAACTVLLSVIRPRLTPCEGTFPHWASLDAAGVRADLGTDRRADAVTVLARIAVAKHKGVARAVDLTRIAGGLFAVAAAITVVGSAL
ncbi:Pycsar system effector family protein [Streptomyces oceani]|uniref:Pycsar effector protein domain-containing protein n=1 Tax=Streptomyces oceani TaxID=1075402 RepID=A0A1E7JVY8_9ACTN|nr:Pycsar system effector family protein [Streptomyces oceani]OEU95478.1 hypothetical protein AN216_23520 [Streptomyces oceani]